VRPSATWTYLVHDNPFGSELDRLIAAVGRRLISAAATEARAQGQRRSGRNAAVSFCPSTVSVAAGRKFGGFDRR